MAVNGSFIPNLPSILAGDIQTGSLFVVEQPNTVTSQTAAQEICKYLFSNITGSSYVTGTSYKNLKILIDGTTYFIPLYTSAQ